MTVILLHVNLKQKKICFSVTDIVNYFDIFNKLFSSLKFQQNLCSYNVFYFYF